jgi:hypothetical protein
MSQDQDILARISSLIAEEHELGAGGGGGEQRDRRKELEVALDQCWDLLRQRQAKRAAGQDPDEAHVRPVEQVERYLQ